MAMPAGRALCLLLALALSVLFCADALASTSYRDADAPEYYVNAYTLTVYDKPNIQSKVREIVPYAKNLKRLYAKNGWAKVYTVNRVLGYCKDSLLTPTNPNTLNARVYCQPKRINVYRYPNVNSSVLGHCYRDERMHAVAMTARGDWLRIDKGEYYGYILRPYVDSQRYSEGRSAWCGSSSAEVYYDSGNDLLLSTLYFGDRVTLLETRGSWAKIRSGSDVIGFCRAENITTTNPNDINATVYTQVEGNFLFLSSTDLSGRIQVEKDVEMTLQAVDENGFWARVQYDGGIFYLPYLYLGTQRCGDGYKKITARAGLNIREGTRNSSAIVATVPKGTEMWLIGAVDNRAKVATLPDASGRTYTGFAELQYLR